MLQLVMEHFANIDSSMINEDDQRSSSSYFSRESKDDFGYCDDSTRMVVVESEDKRVAFHISISPSLYGMSLVVEQLCGSLSNFISFEWIIEKSFRLVLDGDDILLVEPLELNIDGNTFNIDREFLDRVEIGSIGVVTIQVGKFEIYIAFELNEALSGVQLSKAITVTNENFDCIQLTNESEEIIDSHNMKITCCKFDREISIIEIIIEKDNFNVLTPKSSPPSLAVLCDNQIMPLSRAVEEEQEIVLFFNYLDEFKTGKLQVQFHDFRFIKNLECDTCLISKIESYKLATNQIDGLSFKHLFIDLSEKVDHRFIEIAKQYKNSIDCLGFNLMQILVSLGRREHVKALIEKLGFDPVEMDSIKWADFFNNPNGISEYYLLKCLSNFMHSLDNGDESSFAQRVKSIISKLSISCLDHESIISIQNYLIPNCYLSHYFYNNAEKIMSVNRKVNCLLLVVLIKDCEANSFKLGLFFGKWAIFWKENSLVLTSSQQVYGNVIHKIEEITSEKRLEKIARSLCETICSWNGRKFFNMKSCNSGHFVLSFLKKSMLWDAIPLLPLRDIISYTKNNAYGYMCEYEKISNIQNVQQFSFGKSTLFSNRNCQYMDCEGLKEIIENAQESQMSECDGCEFLSDLDFIRDEIFLIGEGGFGKVFKCQDKKTKKWKVLKIVENDIEYELNACKKFNNFEHEHLVPIEDYGIFEDELFILMPYYENGDLTTFINEKGHLVSNINIWQIFNQISESLAYLHKQNIIHRDIKLKNIFVSDYDINRDFIQVVLGDFGCFLDLDSQNDNNNQHLLGSESYRPPENEQTTKADVWSLGICILQLVLIQQKSTLNLTSEILFNNNGDKQHIIQSILDSDLKEILIKCLDSSFSSRIDSIELANTLRILTNSQNILQQNKELSVI